MVVSVQRRQSQPPKTISVKQANFLAPTMGRISSQILRLANDVVTEIARPADKWKIQDFIEMLEVDPASKACVELKALRAITGLGNYTHKEKDKQEWIKGNFDSMQNSLQSAVGQLCSAMPLGFSIAEIVLNSKVPGHRGEWRLEEIIPLDPRRVTFRGRRGKIEEVLYNDGNGVKKVLPYNKCIHVVNGHTTNFGDPFGSAEARRAMPYYRSKQLMLAELTIAAKNQATGILTAFADSNDTVRMIGQDNKPVKNSDGSDRVVSAVEALNFQLQQVENSSIIVTDLKNRIQPLQLPTGENFFNVNLMFLNRQIMLSYGVSSLLFDEGSVGGLGNSGISQAHKSVLDSQIEAVVIQLREQILEKIIKPLLVFNYGSRYAQELGSFQVNASTDPNIIIQKGNFLLTAMTSGIIPSSDLSAINTLREMAGVAPIEQDELQALLNAQIQQQMMQQQAQMAAQPQGVGYP